MYIVNDFTYENMQSIDKKNPGQCPDQIYLKYFEVLKMKLNRIVKS